MMHYEHVNAALAQAEKTLKAALKSTVDSEAEKTALEESLKLIQQAKEKCRLAQKEALQTVFTQGMTLQ